MSNKSKYYSTKQIDDIKAEHRFILGERSNGKSYFLKVKGLETRCNEYEQQNKILYNKTD